MKPRILIVDDEARMASVVAMALSRAGYECEACAGGEAALAALETRGADVVVTDWKMPEMDGIQLLRRLRARRPVVPVILITAFASVPSAVAAMREGAFDYVTKPFSIDELLARVRAATRRGSASALAVTVGDVVVDLSAKTATRSDGDRVHLTPTEWHLLELLVRHPGKLITGRTLLTELRGSPEHTDPSYLRIYMAQLRRKLEPHPDRPQHLITEPGMGYRFQP